MTRLRVKRFDPSTLKSHRIIIIVGKRGTGKSVMQEDLMQYFNADIGMAMTPTEESVEMFRKHMPDCWIYNSFSASKLEGMLNLQRALAREKKQRSVFLIMDDCMYDKQILRGVAIRDLFMNGRHLNVTLCNAVQYVMDMGPDLRTQVDYVFALRENIISNKTKLWKYFFGMFEKYEEFAKVMDKCTENHGALVMDNTIGSTNVEDCIFWYKATLDPPPFRLGKQIFWNFSDKYSKTERQIHEEEADRLEYLRAANAPKTRLVMVQKGDENGNVVD